MARKLAEKQLKDTDAATASNHLQRFQEQPEQEREERNRLAKGEQERAKREQLIRKQLNKQPQSKPLSESQSKQVAKLMSKPPSAEPSQKENVALPQQPLSPMLEQIRGANASDKQPKESKQQVAGLLRKQRDQELELHEAKRRAEAEAIRQAQVEAIRQAQVEAERRKRYEASLIPTAKGVWEAQFEKEQKEMTLEAEKRQRELERTSSFWRRDGLRRPKKNGCGRPRQA